MATVHVIGSGISGLAAATALASHAVPVKLYEAAAHAGGRCRSSADPGFGSIDHGLHFFGGHQRQIGAFLKRINAWDRLQRLTPPYPFHDLLTGKSWAIAPWRPWPNAPLADHAMLAGGLIGSHDTAMENLLPAHSPLQEEWISPVSRLMLHTPPQTAPSQAGKRMLRQMLRRGGGSFYMARDSLNDTFIQPALHHLEYHGGSVYFSHALKGLDMGAEGIRNLNFPRRKLALMPDDVVILATPAAVTKHFLPHLHTPGATSSAITFHFRVPHREQPGTARVMVNAPFDLVRYKDASIHVALRIADHAWQADVDYLAGRVWAGLQSMHPYLAHEPLGDWGVWREKQAGHQLQASLPAQQLPPRCLLAGDWLDPSQPATLEAAAASGHQAALATLKLIGKYPERAQQDFYLN